MTTAVAEFVIDARPEAWRAVGFDVGVADDDGHARLQLGGISIRLTGTDPVARAGSAMTEWVLAGAPDTDIAEIDGLRTTHVPAAAQPRAATEHPNGVVGIDHVVVFTPDLEKSCDAIAAATGAPLKRIREAGDVRQGFHRLGELIVEVATSPTVTVSHATFWGLALNVADIDAIYARCGDALMSPPKQAVQQGRRIASFRKNAGLGLPVAVMSVADS